MHLWVESKDIRITNIQPNNELHKFLLTINPIETNYELIRVGGNADGGYLIPNDLDGIKHCFSPGVSTVANFENDLTLRGITCFLADFSVEKPPIENKLFDFEKKYLGPEDSHNFFRLESWINKKLKKYGDLILQMDIEGAEYGVLLETKEEVLKKFRIIVIEFHYLDSLLDPLGFELIKLSFSKILKDFEIVHIHPNNCSKPIKHKDIEIPPVLEITFLRKDRIKSASKTLSFPHALDITNVMENQDFPLPKSWYRS